jgi:predicted dehydrogenase
MTEPIRVGVVGCGEVAQIIHLPTLRELGGLFRVTALCDVSPMVLEAVGRMVPDAQTFGDHRDLLARADVDAVLIANPHVYHFEVALEAMEAGKHVLIEKPVCVTLDEADALLAAEARSGVVAQVGFMRRHAPAFVEAVERIAAIRDRIILARVEDVIGQNAMIIDSTSPVVRGTDVGAEVLDRGRSALAEATRKAIGVGEGPVATAYGLLLGLSSHDISAMRELIGRPEGVLHATLRNGGRALTAAFDYGHFVCQFQTAIDTIPHFDAYLEVNAADQILRVDYDTPYIRHLPAKLTVTQRHGEAGCARSVSFPTRYDSFAIEWRDFHANITEARRPKTSIADAREDLVLFKRMIELMT